MEKENSTEEEPVGFPAPKNADEVDLHISVPTKNNLSDDETVGTATITGEERLEQTPYIHEDDHDIKPSTIPPKHLLSHEHKDEIVPSSKRHLVDAETEDTSNDMEIRGREGDKFTDDISSVGLLNSEKLVSTRAGESDIQKENQEKGNSINDITLNSTATGIERSGLEDKSSTDNSSLPSTSTAKHLLAHEHDEELVSSSMKHLVDAEMEDALNDMEIRSQEDDRFSDDCTSSAVGLSHSKSSVSFRADRPDVKQEDQEKSNSVNDTSIKISCHEDDNSTDNSSSPLVRLGNSIDILTGDANIQKEDQEKGNSIDDRTAASIELKSREEDNFATNSSSSSPSRLSSSKNSRNALEILDRVNDKNDTGQSPKATIVNHHCTENIEMKSKDVSHTTFSKKDGESSSFEETGDMKTDVPDNTSGKKEESLVLYGTREPKVESKTAARPEKTSVLTKFVKLCAASNIFRHLSKGTDEHNDSNEKDNTNNESSTGGSQKVSHTTPEKPRWSLSSLSLIRISNDKNQGNKSDSEEVFLESPELIATKGRIILYTKLWCPKCKEARKILRKRRLRYSEINIDMYPSRKLELEDMTGSSDVPKVFFNQVLIDGLKKLKRLDESGQLEKKIEYVTSEAPSPKAPLPPLSGEDDVSTMGGVDELAVIIQKMKASIVVRDRFYKFHRVTNCFLGSEAVDFLSEDQLLEREGAIEFARKLAKELFFRHVLEENTFEDGNHLYRFLDQDPVISQCQNIPRGIIQRKRQTLVELSRRLRFLLYAILDAYTSEDGRHISYRSIHGSEEFARYLRIAEELQRLDLNKTAKEERLAFFINLYNLMAIHAILMWGHPEGALDRRKLFNDFKYVIGGCAYSLSDIQNGILRANQRPPYSLIRPFAISDKRFKVSLPYLEPLIHFALVSGNRSAPALRCYSPKNIDRELMEAARDFLQSGAFVLHLDSMSISITKILKWYSVDFGKNEVEVLKHAAIYLEVEKTRTFLELLDSTPLKVIYQPYDWRLNS